MTDGLAFKKNLDPRRSTDHQKSADRGDPDERGVMEADIAGLGAATLRSSTLAQLLLLRVLVGSMSQIKGVKNEA